MRCPSILSGCVEYNLQIEDEVIPCYFNFCSFSFLRAQENYELVYFNLFIFLNNTNPSNTSPLQFIMSLRRTPSHRSNTNTKPVVTFRGHRRDSFKAIDQAEVVELRARYRTFHGAYSRTALMVLGESFNLDSEDLMSTVLSRGADGVES